MAEGKSGRKSAASTKTAKKSGSSRNETPNTPEVAESKIARLKVDELRKRLKRRGVEVTEKLRKDDLVKKLIKAERADAGSGSARASGSAKGATKGGSAKSGTKDATAKKSTAAKRSNNDTPNTPDVDESKIARLKVSELRERLKERGVADTGKLRKDDLVRKLVKAYVADTRSGGKKSATKASVGSKGGGKKSGGKGGIRTGKQTSKSLKYSQEITSVQDEPERPGRSLVTTDHEVIRRWAQARDAVPATIEGTEHEDHLGVLRFDFPGGSSGGRLRQVDWDEWFATFDERRLNFIYQQERSDGRQSNFFQLESPDREDA